MSRAPAWPFAGRSRVCVSVARADLEGVGAALNAVRGADLVEVRLDALDDPAGLDEHALRELIEASHVPLGFTLRPAWEGGGFTGPEDERRRLIDTAAHSGATFVDIELDAEWCRDFLDDAPCAVIASHHWDEARPADLRARVEQLDDLSPSVAKLVAVADDPADALPLLDAGKALAERGQPAACFSMGEAGAASRLLSIGDGAALVYAAIDSDEPVAPGQWPVGRLVRELRVPEWPPGAGFCGLVGDPIIHSLSPAIFNAAFRAFGFPLVYAPMPGAALGGSLEVAAAREFRGLSVTMPFKEEAARSCARLDPIAASIGAVNTLVAEADGWHGFNTDGAAVVESLAAAIDVTGADVAIVGAGGAARAAAVALVDAGSNVDVLNRSPEKAAAVAALAKASSGDLGELTKKGYDAIINATPVGMAGICAEGETPFPPDWLEGTETVFDMVYRPRRTALLVAAERAGCATIEGLEMFVRQAAAQYRLWTGDESDEPLQVIRAAAASALLEDESVQK